MDCALDLARTNAGNSILARIAMIAMTTNSSMRVKADFETGQNTDLVFIFCSLSFFLRQSYRQILDERRASSLDY